MIDLRLNDEVLFIFTRCALKYGYTFRLMQQVGRVFIGHYRYYSSGSLLFLTVQRIRPAHTQTAAVATTVPEIIMLHNNNPERDELIFAKTLQNPVQPTESRLFYLNIL